MLWTLLHRDYKGRDFQNSLPVTEATIENLINGFTPFESWLFNVLIEGRAFRSYDQHSSSYGVLQMELFEKPVETDALYLSYSSYAAGGYRERKEGFGIRLRKILPSVRKGRPRTDGERSPHYYFPSLEQARKEFEDHFGVTIDWENI